MTKNARLLSRVAATIGFVALGGLMPTTAGAQVLRAGANGDQFDVASVKPSAVGPQVPLPRILPSGELQIPGATLRDLIRMAYPSPSGQVFVEGGPDWVTTARFDVVAKAAAGAMPTAMMLRATLKERFRLQARPATREGSVFALVMARHDGRLGPSLTLAPCDVSAPTADPNTACSQLRIGAGPTLIGESITMARLASTLSEFPILSAPVVDRTGLVGTYNVRMQYRGANNPNPDAGPLMPAALEEQLGLKLERTKGTIDVVVIESVEKLEAN